LGQHYFVRAQAAQAAPNIWLESLHLGTLRGNQSKSFIFLNTVTLPQSGPPLFSLGRERQLNQAPNCF